MSKTKIEMFAEKIAGSEKDVHGRTESSYAIGEVYYSKGGMNYFSGNATKRGYRISVDVRTRGAGFESFLMFNNVAKGEFLEEAKAFNAKKLERFAADPAILARLQALKAQVVAIHQAKHQTEAVAV